MIGKTWLHFRCRARLDSRPPMSRRLVAADAVAQLQAQPAAPSTTRLVTQLAGRTTEVPTHVLNLLVSLFQHVVRTRTSLHLLTSPFALDLYSVS
mmetsp:Transcript_1794/g.4958  ORF Transcript_1794/g.4958 Transcript_1794/m.4958 type:complete len:95 (+) Transcript_1794:331-615(+)